MKPWMRLREFVRIESEWVRVLGEKWLSDKGEQLEHWRVEKSDSVIVLPIQNEHLFCVRPTFRVGIQRGTLDFPGGRVLAGKRPEQMVSLILERELGITPNAVSSVISLNAKPWVINSSFSNQGLWGFVAVIDEDHVIPDESIGKKTPNHAAGIGELLDKLECLQCRSLLLEWCHMVSEKRPPSPLPIKRS